MHSFVTQWINFENSFTLITREVARMALCYAAISYFGVTFSPAILRALNFNLICLLIKYTICEPKIFYCRIAQCHSVHLHGHQIEGIFKIDSLGHKRINKHFLKSSIRAYWTGSITIITSGTDWEFWECVMVNSSEFGNILDFDIWLLSQLVGLCVDFWSKFQSGMGILR